jgi:hypothetical protein
MASMRIFKSIAIGIAAFALTLVSCAIAALYMIDAGWPVGIRMIVGLLIGIAIGASATVAIRRLQP